MQWVRIVILIQKIDKISFKYQILSCEDLPKPQSNRGNKVSNNLEALINNI